MASRKYPETFWTHNDGSSGKLQALFALTRHGQSIADFSLVNIALTDWEDIAIDDSGHLFIADTGNNESKRKKIFVYQVNEPDPKGPRVLVEPNRSWELTFPNRPFDCEALFVYRDSGYLISKVVNDRPAELFRFALGTEKKPIVLERVARLPITSPVTGADLSPNGQILGVVCKAGAYAFRIDGDVSKVGSVAPARTKFKHEHIEGCAFVPEGLLATAESREIYLFNNAHFLPGDRE